MTNKIRPSVKEGASRYRWAFWTFAILLRMIVLGMCLYYLLQASSDVPQRFFSGCLFVVISIETFDGLSRGWEILCSLVSVAMCMGLIFLGGWYVVFGAVFTIANIYNLKKLIDKREKKMFGKKSEKCGCEQKRKMGTCRQCYNRLDGRIKILEAELAEAKEQAEIAERMFASIDAENDQMRVEAEDIKKELDTVAKFRKGPTEPTIN